MTEIQVDEGTAESLPRRFCSAALVAESCKQGKLLQLTNYLYRCVTIAIAYRSYDARVRCSRVIWKRINISKTIADTPNFTYTDTLYGVEVGIG